MVIKSITLKNFRMFKNQHIEFSTDSNSGMTIILGENTYGKTTLVNAFIWCLYGENRFKRGDQVLLNRDVADSLSPNAEAEVSVSLELSHGNYNYLITTKQKYKKKNDGTSVYVEGSLERFLQKANSIDGIPVPIGTAYISAEINSILRSELKDYFFFDGENNKVQDVATKGNLQDAVLNILDRQKVKDVCNLFYPKSPDGVIAGLKNEIVNSHADLFDPDNDLQSKINDEYAKIDDFDKKISADRIVIDELAKKKSEYQEIQDANKNTIELNERKKNLEQKIEEKKSEIEPAFKKAIDALNLCNSLLPVLFAKSYKAFDMLALINTVTTSNINSYIGITAEGVDDLISRGYCVCGAKIETGSETHKHLIEAKSNMKSRSYDGKIKRFQSIEDDQNYVAPSRASSIIDGSANFIKTLDERDKAQDDLTEVKRLLGSNNSDYSDLQDKIDETNVAIGQKEAEIRIYTEQKKNSEIAVQKYEEELKEKTKNDENNAFIYKCIDYLTRIYNSAKNFIDKCNEQVRVSLQKEVQKIFNEVFHGNRTIEIADNLAVKVNGGSSGGLDIVSSFSFVIGLMNLAKSTILQEELKFIVDEDAIDNDYPLVLDAPFSDLDEIHIKNLCTAFAKYSRQTVIFIKNRDFESIDGGIYTHIGKKYTIKQKSDFDSVIEESD